MRSHCAIYVDTAYLLASAATRFTGTSLRSGITIDPDVLIRGLITQVEQDSGLPLLRVNWYDSGARRGGMPDSEQEEIGLLPRVKLRLGRLSVSGEQKGVDLRIGLDLATHGRSRIVDVMYLVSGDDDLTEAVEEAQAHGAQVIVLGLPIDGRAHGVAKHLQRAADGLQLIDEETIEAAIRPAVRPAAAPLRPHPVPTAPLPGPGRLVPGSPARPTPSPSLLAQRRTEAASPDRVPVYSTTTGQAPVTGHGFGELPVLIDEGLIDEVARRVVDSWRATATADQLEELRRSRPSIPRELDRTLLLDMVSRSGEDDIGDISRHQLRDRFWHRIDETHTA
ncbi:NYN domain-containing protein [Granulicoccus phenolivorans]|uniref:NYN domain-containing protein n=1 Tax=Granulicoccus phenolivorans TaxID=266854 RepID=UPI000409BAE1|nr:NYN domain-containing protein [Granulicoccus phenolivorans]